MKTGKTMSIEDAIAATRGAASCSRGAEQERMNPKTFSVYARSADGTMTKQHVIQSFVDASSVVLVIEELK